MVPPPQWAQTMLAVGNRRAKRMTWSGVTVPLPGYRWPTGSARGGRGSHCLHDIVVVVAAKVHLSPAKPKHHRLVHTAPIHGGNQILGRAQPRVRVGVQIPEPGVADQVFVAPGNG